MMKPSTELIEQYQVLQLLRAFFKIKHPATRREVIEAAERLTKAVSAIEQKDLH